MAEPLHTDNHNADLVHVPLSHNVVRHVECDLLLYRERNLVISRLIEPFLRPFDNEEREWVLRWRIWKADWFPYRTAEFLGLNEDETDMVLGPWEWHRPRKWRRR